METADEHRRELAAEAADLSLRLLRLSKELSVAPRKGDVVEVEGS
jgi:hypothetical protein